MVLLVWCAARLAAQPPVPTDASGMAWIEDDRFLVVHDSKRPKELDRPRVSIVRLPRDKAGLDWRPLDVEWPQPEGPSHDLESIARVPGTDTYLLAESGDDGASFRRIFVAEFEDGELRIKAVVPWPVPVHNVEGIAVARAGSHYLFIFAERAHGQGQTQIAWASFTLEPLAFGTFEKAVMPAAGPAGPASRTVAALAVDAAGQIYAASTFDPDTDGGPFSSAVWRIGTVETAGDGRPRVLLAHPPEPVATLDGLKVESLAIRESERGATELFIGTDDEDYGAVIRPLPQPVR